MANQCASCFHKISTPKQTLINSSSRLDRVLKYHAHDAVQVVLLSIARRSAPRSTRNLRKMATMTKQFAPAISRRSHDLFVF